MTTQPMTAVDLSFQNASLPINSDPAALKALAAGTPKIPRPGFLQRLNAQPNSAFLALAAGLLSGQSFQDGLGKGLTAYQAALEAERDRKQPKRTPVINGAFERVETPEGVTYAPNEAVQDFQGEQAEMAYGRKLGFQQLRDENLFKRLTMQFGHQVNVEQLRIKAQAGDAQADRQLQLLIAQMNNATDLEEARMTASSRDSRPPPPAALNKHTELVSSQSRVGSSLGDVDRIMGYLHNGDLDLGIVQNLRQKAAVAGWPLAANGQTPQYAEFAQLMERMRNVRLLENVGVQTDGDALRAYNELLAGTGDEKAVLRNLAIVKRELERQNGVLQGAVSKYENTYGIQGDSLSAPSPAPRNSTTSTGIKWRRVQ